jgi:hypothetical protein
MTNVIRDQVFISYGRADQSPNDWLSKLQLHLGLFKRQGVVDVWDDKRIETGSRWREQIKQAIGRAKVAALLDGLPMRGFAAVPFPFSLQSRLDERGYLEDTNDEVYVSRTSLWEMAIKVRLGKNPYTLPNYPIYFRLGVLA